MVRKHLQTGILRAESADNYDYYIKNVRCITGRTMDKTIIDSVGKGVEYSSFAPCNALGIEGLSCAWSVGNSSSSIVPRHRSALGRSGLRDIETRPADGLR